MHGRPVTSMSALGSKQLLRCGMQYGFSTSSPQLIPLSFWRYGCE
jgi:hypothetical protein